MQEKTATIKNLLFKLRLHFLKQVCTHFLYVFNSKYTFCLLQSFGKSMLPKRLFLKLFLCRPPQNDTNWALTKYMNIMFLFFKVLISIILFRLLLLQMHLKPLEVILQGIFSCYQWFQFINIRNSANLFMSYI